MESFVSHIRAACIVKLHFIAFRLTTERRSRVVGTSASY